ncbi:hypothetical protein [Paenibacillus sp. P32E]|uniref:hypothetical protein n=1 Tax=Paenibacillus sp. P32E TaxID=1349434 RepID=UPI0015C02F6B|nr:hypothetical protein [Paenibacillus sp. P32E]
MVNSKYILSKTESNIESILFFFIIGATLFICERSGINNKKVNLAFGLFLLAAGVIIDLITQ